MPTRAPLAASHHRASIWPPARPRGVVLGWSWGHPGPGDGCLVTAPSDGRGTTPAPRRSRPVFDLDVKTLEGEYKSLQKQLHPDKFAQRPPEEQKLSAEQASVVNVAYDTLTEPLSRALYIVRPAHHLTPPHFRCAALPPPSSASRVVEAECPPALHR